MFSLLIYLLQAVPVARFKDPRTASSGMVEIWKNGTWAPLCSSDFGHNESIVACNMLGYRFVVIVIVL